PGGRGLRRHPMNGRAEVARLRQRLNDTFGRVGAISGPLELQSDFAKYLCVLVAGFLEQATVELAAEWVRHRSDERTLRHVLKRLERFQNPNRERLLQLIGSFDSDWRKDVEAFI